jgi:hypothetical protein
MHVLHSVPSSVAFDKLLQSAEVLVETLCEKLREDRRWYKAARQAEVLDDDVSPGYERPPGVVSRAEVRRAESGAPRSRQLIWPPPALHARILESPLDRHELVDEEGSGGGCAGIVEEAERSEHHLR